MTKRGGTRKKIEKKRRSRRIRRRVLLFLVLLLFLSGAGYGIYYHITHRLGTVYPTQIKYRDVVRDKGYLIYEEDTVFTKGNGIAIYNVREGKKVPKGHVVANINVMNDNSEIKDRLIKVNAAIDFKNDRKNKDKSEDLTKEDVNVIRNIQRFIRDEDGEKLISSINTLDLRTKPAVNVSELNELLKLSPDALEEQRNILTEKIATTNSDYKAPISGIISYRFDDLRGALSPKKDDSVFTTAYLKGLKLTPIERGENRVKEDHAFFRSIGDTEYKVALSVEDLRLLSEGENKRLDVRIGNVTAKGEIESVNREGRGGVVILRLQDKLQEVYAPRVQEVTIIKSEEPAYAVPKECIVRGPDGETGVYADAIRGFVKFVPVSVLSRDAKRAYLRVGDADGRILVAKGDKKPTVSADDAIVLKPNKVDKTRVIY